MSKVTNIVVSGKSGAGKQPRIDVLVEEFDCGEPEDNTFDRDWNWVSGAIEQAYKLGREDVGKEIAENILNI